MPPKAMSSGTAGARATPTGDPKLHKTSCVGLTLFCRAHSWGRGAVYENPDTLQGSWRTHGALWIAMEYCGGGSVADLVHAADGPLAQPIIAYLCAETLSGLAYLHSIGKVLAQWTFHYRLKGVRVPTEAGWNCNIFFGTCVFGGPSLCDGHSPGRVPGAAGQRLTWLVCMCSACMCSAGDSRRPPCASSAHQAYIPTTAACHSRVSAGERWSTRTARARGVLLTGGGHKCRAAATACSEPLLNSCAPCRWTGTSSAGILC